MILPSILSASHLFLKEKLDALKEFNPMLHIDLEDGRYVPNLSFGPKIIKEIYDTYNFQLDVHYMVEDPQRFIDIFSDIPQKMISYHVETGISPNDLTIPKGSSIGVALNPDTHSMPDRILSEIDFIVIMGVHPGFGGAKFLESTYDKVSQFDTMRKQEGYEMEIVVDGGVTKDNISRLHSNGADHFVVGAGIFRHDPAESYKELLNLV